MSEHEDKPKPFDHGPKHHEPRREHKPAPAKKASAAKLLKWLVIIGIVQVVLLLIIASQLSGLNAVSGGDSGTGDAPTPTAAAPSPSAPSAPVDMEALIDDDHVKGDPDAPVTIVEWSDYECPFCVRFYSQTLGQIDSQYIETGKVKLVYRDFPLSFHPQAQKAAEAAECAGEQDMYYEMHDKLFEDGVTGGVASFKTFARDLGLNAVDFDTCLDSGSMAGEVAKDMRDGQRAGVQGTPGFIINGQLLSGALPFSAFQQAIEAALTE